VHLGYTVVGGRVSLLLCCLPLRWPLVSVALEDVSCRGESVCVKQWYVTLVMCRGGYAS
jgi:hypothetical protein